MRKTIKEILFQPEAWAKTIAAFSDQKNNILRFMKNYQDAELILTGCGTSYYLPLTAAALYTKYTGKPARGIPASEIMLYPETVFARNRKYLLISISRTGKTPETLAATRYVREVIKGGTLLITCTGGSEVSEFSDLTLVCPEAAEETKYMTKSFTSMLLCFQMITAFLSANKKLEQDLRLLPQHGTRLISEYQESMERLAYEEDYALYVLLGHGPLYGIAAESMLKIKEMACIPAEAYHGMELMHGPKYAVDDQTIIFYLLSDAVQEKEIELLKRIRDWGGNIKIICEQGSAKIEAVSHRVFALRSGLSEDARFVLIMLLTQLYGYYRALATNKEIA